MAWSGEDDKVLGLYVADIVHYLRYAHESAVFYSFCSADDDAVLASEAILCHDGAYVLCWYGNKEDVGIVFELLGVVSCCYVVG